MRAELAQQTDGPLERLLIERVLTTWLQLGYADVTAAQYAAGKADLNWTRYYQERIDRAHKRYLSAIKTLATVRRLARPAVQINVGENKVNVVEAPTDLARKSA